MDFPAIWKTSSILLTGGFGILGLLKDFKDKETHKVTRWGYVSLAGILLSTILGTAAQWIQSESDAAKAAEASKQTLALTQRSTKTLNDVERLLVPLDDPTLTIDFEVPCNESRFTVYCEKAKELILAHDVTNFFNLTDEWPKDPRSERISAAVAVHTLLNINTDRVPDGHLLYWVLANSRSDDPTARVHSDYLVSIHAEPILVLAVNGYKPQPPFNKGNLHSMLDLRGASLFIDEFDTGEQLFPYSLVIKSKQGAAVYASSCNETKPDPKRVGGLPVEDVVKHVRSFQCTLVDQ